MPLPQQRRSLRDLVDAIRFKHGIGIQVNPPATATQIDWFERTVGFRLPEDFKEFYSVCNGFDCDKDIFTFISLASCLEHREDSGDNWFYFAEYMIYSDMWGLRLVNGEYEIFNASYPDKSLTSSLAEFLTRYLEGDVFDPGGLYPWQDELGIKGDAT
jgi:hypothetical protein